MASIHKETRNGRTLWRIQFYDKNNKRQSIRLGSDINRKGAESIRAKVEALVSASITGGALDNEVSRWVADRGDGLASKLARHGLIPGRQKAAAGDGMTLGAFLDGYFAAKAFRKPNTERNYKVTRGHLLDYFGRDRLLTDISAGCADEWREHLFGKLGLSSATVSREVKRARQFFRAAVRKRLIAENPFADLPAPQQVNKDREFFVDRATIEKVIAACPDAEWRLIVALSRYGGLRCPSEHLSLELDDVDWANDRMTVRSPKTEHHPSGATRIVPLFPELRPYLEAIWEVAKPGTRYFISRYRDKNSNLRTQFLRIIKRAGVKPWPKLFQNLRASRETELAEKYPIHVVCEWIGNSPKVAEDHYLQMREEYYRRAVTEGGATGGAEVVQKLVPSAKAPIRTDSQETKKPSGLATQNVAVPMVKILYLVPPRGV